MRLEYSLPNIGLDPNEVKGDLHHQNWRQPTNQRLRLVYPPRSEDWIETLLHNT